MSTLCGWCSRAGYDECFCGAMRPQYDDRDHTIREQNEKIFELELELRRRAEVLMRLWNLISQNSKLYKEARKATAGIYPERK